MSAVRCRPHGDRLDVSVIIPVFNRAQLLRELTAALATQTLEPSRFEVIIVDNCSTDDTHDLAIALAEEVQFRCLVLRTSENRGPSAARNAGARRAEGALLAFTDSDCAPHAEWLRIGLETFDTGAAIVSGPLLDKPNQATRFFSRTNHSGFDGEDPWFPTANIFYARELFERLGGFDESLYLRDLRSHPIELCDTDLAWRALAAGESSAFRPDCIVYHEVENISPIQWLLDATRLTVIPALLRRHPEQRRRALYWNYFVKPENMLSYLALLGVILGVGAHLGFFALSLPLAVWCIGQFRGNLGLKGLPKVFTQAVFFAARELVGIMCLILGSIRFRCVVL